MKVAGLYVDYQQTDPVDATFSIQLTTGPQVCSALETDDAEAKSTELEENSASAMCQGENSRCIQP